MGLLDLGASVLERLRISLLVPRLAVAVEGEARLCTYDHVPIFVSGAPERPPIARHIDVSLELWNKGHEAVAILEVRRARAAGQDLLDGTEIETHSFSALTLVPGQPKTKASFSLSPAAGQALLADRGHAVEFGLRLGRNGRDRRVKLEIGAA